MIRPLFLSGKNTYLSVLLSVLIVTVLISCSKSAGSQDGVTTITTSSAPTGTIVTIAGGSIGDGGAATSTITNQPYGVAVDFAGSVYIADTYNSRIRKVNTAGVITTVAGNGVEGFSGDNGPASSGSLYRPRGVAVDSGGNVYIADTFNERIRKVDASGMITTVAGNGTLGFSGDNGPATSANLCSPTGVTVDSAGNIYIADAGNNRIRMVNTSGFITTVAGGGSGGDNGPATSASLNFPDSVTLDSAGNIYIVDQGNNRIRKVNSSGVITTVAGKGWTIYYFMDNVQATSATLWNPNGIAIDFAGNIYIADRDNNRIRKVDTSGLITTVAGNGTVGFSGDNGPSTSASLNQPNSVAVDSAGNIYIADRDNNRIRKVDTSGLITTVAGNGTIGFSGDNGPATSASLYGPTGVTRDVVGNIYIADYYNHRIRKVDTSGVITTVAGNGIAGFSGDNGPATSASLKNPNCVVIDSFGNIYIADTFNQRIRKVDTSGVITTVAGNGSRGFSGDNGTAVSASLYDPHGVSIDAAGNIYIADTTSNRVRKVNTSGVITTVAGNGTLGFSGDNGIATSARIYNPYGVLVDATGNVYIADSWSNRIRKVNTSGVITTVAGNGSIGYSGDNGPATSASIFAPGSIAVDAMENIFIADSNNNRIRMVDTSGMITTVAGNGVAGFSGDNGFATSGSLNQPFGVFTDLTGNIYIADSGNNRIRLVTTRH